MTIKHQITTILKELQSVEHEHYQAGSTVDKIPTLEKDMYRKASPMLQELYAEVSYLLDATHGDWLSVYQMRALWKIDQTDNTH